MRWGIAWTFQQNINLTNILGTKVRRIATPTVLVGSNPEHVSGSDSECPVTLRIRT